MRIFKAQAGPFREQPYYEDHEIESIALDELRGVGLLPSSPEPIRVERFIEKRFHVVPTYDDLQDGVLGFTRFGSEGVAEVVISRALAEEGVSVAERRINSTLAHEAGHMLLHTYLFALELRGGSASLFNDDLDQRQQKILCRTDAVSGSARTESPRRYDGRWWEVQANMVIGALLLPGPLVSRTVEPLLAPQGQLGVKVLDPNRRDDAVRLLATTFDVNPVVARIRLKALYPEQHGARQLTL